MDKNDDIGPGGGQSVSREHVEHILRRAGLNEDQIAAALDGVEFPSPLSKMLPRLLERGISPTMLTDRLGGSP